MPDDSISDVEPSTESDTPPAPSAPLAPLAPPPKVVKIHLDRPCKVQSVLLTGLNRTKPDYLTERIRGLLDVSNYHELLEAVAETRQAIGSMGIFKNVNAVMDSGAGLEDIRVRFEFVETNVTARVGVEVGDNSATGTMSLSLPNLCGRGEKLSLKCGAPNPGSDKFRDYNLTLSKPFPSRLIDSVEMCLSRIEYQLEHFKCANLSHRLETSCALSSFIGRHVISLDWDWRQLSATAPATSMYLREHTGHSLKSAIRHTLLIDTRDNRNVVSPGFYLSAHQEYSGLVPDSSRYLKAEAHTEANLPSIAGIILSLTGRAGYLHSLGDQTNPLDRFLLGGPTSLRGFGLWGISPRDRDCSLGANTYWAAGAHLYSPLPFWSEGLGQYFRLHAFATAGNLFNLKETGSFRGALGGMRDGFRLSAGVGILWRISFIRIEVNWCRILLSGRRDSFQAGLQFGVGVDFL